MFYLNDPLKETKNEGKTLLARIRRLSTLENATTNISCTTSIFFKTTRDHQRLQIRAGTLVQTVSSCHWVQKNIISKEAICEFLNYCASSFTGLGVIPLITFQNQRRIWGSDLFSELTLRGRQRLFLLVFSLLFTNFQMSTYLREKRQGGGGLCITRGLFEQVIANLSYSELLKIDAHSR